MTVISKEVLLFCQIFGCFPLKLSKGFRGTTSLVFSTQIFLYGVVVNTIVTICAFCSLLFDYMGKLAGHPVRMTSNKIVFAIVLDTTFLILMAVSAFVCSVKKHRAFIEMFDILKKVDKRLHYTYNEYKTKIKVIIIFVFLTSFLLTTASCVFPSSFLKSIEKTSYFYIIGMAFYYSQASLFVHFTFITENIAKRFQVVNIKITQEVKKHIITNIRGKNYVSKVLQYTDVASTVSSVRSLSSSYWLLCEAVDKANSFYSTQMFFAVFSSFTHIVVTLYYGYLVALEGLTPLTMALQLLWISFHVIHLVLLISPSTAITDAADMTAPTICRLVNKDIHLLVREQLQTFLLYLTHHNARVSADGFFQVNNFILTSIAGSTTTYLVVLIQFQTSHVQNQDYSVSNLTLTNVSNVL